MQRFARTTRLATVLWTIIMLLVLTNMYIAYRASRTEITVAAELQWSNDRVVSYERLLSDLRDAETGQRGFIITGDPKYLEPYNSAAKRIEQDSRALPQSSLRKDVTERAQAKLAELAKTIALRQQGSEAAAVSVVRTDYGKAEMDAIRRDIGILEDSERKRRAELERQRSGARDRSRATFFLASFGVLIVLGIFAAFSVRYEDRLRSQVHRATESLRQMVKDAETFNYSVSHDLRSPLRGIRTKIHLLGEDSRSAVGRESLQEIDREAERLDKLGEIELRPVSVETCVLAALSQLQFPAGVTTDLGKELPLIVAHPETLVQMLANLIDNALKFTKEGERADVTIRAGAIGSKVRISVQDQGIGIPENQTKRVFAAFERLDRSRAGSGLGLAIVKRGAERMKGEVEVHSALGEGSTFSISLPATPYQIRRSA